MVQEIVKKNAKGRDEVIGRKIFIGKKELKLRFTMPMWFKMEDEICLMDDLYTMMHSKGRFARDKIPALVEIMAGGEVTADEILAEDDPATYRAMLDEIQAVIAKAMTMKEKKYDDDSIHDEVLEEIEKKDKKAD